MNQSNHEVPLNRVVGALIGLACGDAVGTTLEFKPRGSFEPITDMVGGGPFSLNTGEWTDDTSMALCLAHSLVDTKMFDPVDQMNRYCRWFNEGYMSSNGRCFDIGIAVSSALNRYLASGEPFAGSEDPLSAGNGSLMRLAPIVMATHKQEEVSIELAGQSSKTTHAAMECIDACQFFGTLLWQAFRSGTKVDIFKKSRYQAITPKVANIADLQFLEYGYDELTGSGYVIESLESALWCFMHSESFEEAILLAANIGNDADTTAAICGQIAGAYYGISSIPEQWKNKLAYYDEIYQIGAALYELGSEKQLTYKD